MEISILDKMAHLDTRKAFITYRQNCLSQDPELLENLVEYLNSDTFDSDISRMLKGEYFFDPPKRILLKKKYSDSKRVVYQFKLHERFLLMLMSHVLHDYDHIFSDDLYSFRRNRNGADFLERVKLTKNISSMWALKTDFSKYGESIDVEILISQLKNIFPKDEKFLTFITQFLRDKRYFWKGQFKDDMYGLKSGSPLTNVFENIYAMEVDRVMAKISNVYGRYGDDIVAFFNTREEAEHAREVLSSEVAKIRLSFNERKTYIVPAGESVEVLGMKITGNQIDVADSSIEKIEFRYRRLAKRILIKKRAQKLSDELAMSMFINAVNRRFFTFSEDKHELNWCRWAFPVITRIDSLKEIDHILQDCIRYIGSGKKSDSRFRVRYKQLQKLGYRSLVHHYYHAEELLESPDNIGVINN